MQRAKRFGLARLTAYTTMKKAQSVLTMKTAQKTTAKMRRAMTIVLMTIVRKKERKKKELIHLHIYICCFFALCEQAFSSMLGGSSRTLTTLRQT